MNRNYFLVAAFLAATSLTAQPLQESSSRQYSLCLMEK